MATESTVAGPSPPVTGEYERAQNRPVDPVEVVENHEEEPATESHALANTEVPHDEKGAAQHEHGETEVKDLGWSENSQDILPLVGGLPNEELWTLIRRFNKVC
jgi:hypothetical protein